MKFYIIILLFFVHCISLKSQCSVDSFTVTVLTTNGDPMANVKITILGNSPQVAVLTDANGKAVIGNDACVSISLSLSREIHYIEGVTTLDLVRISRHILRQKPFTNKYNLIAADANNDGRITASDLTDLRKLILGITTELPKNESYKFIWESDKHQNYNFSSLKDIIANNNINIYFVKIGDISVE